MDDARLTADALAPAVGDRLPLTRFSRATQAQDHRLCAHLGVRKARPSMSPLTRSPLPALAILALLVAGCGGSDEPADTAAARGAALSRVHGCASCHGADGQGGFGPPWQGLAGSEVELSDGRTVVADEAYLRRAITDPEAERRAGYAVQMPAVPLSEQEVEDLVAHIETFR